MDYAVYGGGFQVVSADLTINTGKSDYDIRLAAYTHGLLGKLAPWKGVFESEGWYNAKTGEGMPSLHRSTSTWRGEDEIKTYRYNKDGSFRDYRILEEGKPEEIKTVDPKLTNGTTDAFTAALSIMNKVARDGKCEGSDQVFDGKRRFEQVFVHKGEVKLESSRLNVYSGLATECTVEVKPVAGKWHDKPRGWMSIQEQGRAKGTMPTVWFASMAEGEPAIPVKIRVKTEYGTLFMHLTRYNDGQKTLKLAE